MNTRPRLEGMHAATSSTTGWIEAHEGHGSRCFFCGDPAGAFKPLELDGLSTQPGYVPKKSNWARRIDKPPFLAFPIICGNCFTFGGLKVDTQARVINADGAVIPGLYAAGETIGLYYGTYAGATSVLRGAVFGRIAGLHATSRMS